VLDPVGPVGQPRRQELGQAGPLGLGLLDEAGIVRVNRWLLVGPGRGVVAHVFTLARVSEMASPMIELARPRHGHFDLGTGYHGDLWLDLDALFARPALLRPHVRSVAERLRELRVDAVCGPMEGGAFLAYALADLLEVAFLPAYRAAGPDGGAGNGDGLPAGPGRRRGRRDRRVAGGHRR
jgi:hypothetical protein